MNEEERVREWEKGSVWKYTNVGDNGGGVGGNNDDDDDERKCRLLYVSSIRSNWIATNRNIYKLVRTTHIRRKDWDKIAVFYVLLGVAYGDSVESIFEYYVIVFLILESLRIVYFVENRAVISKRASDSLQTKPNKTNPFKLFQAISIAVCCWANLLGKQTSTVEIKYWKCGFSNEMRLSWQCRRGKTCSSL